MAERALFISWGAPVRGREERGLNVFNDAAALFKRMRDEGRVERFAIVLLEPNGDINGYIELTGSAEQLAGIRADEDYQRVISAASMVVDRLRVIEGSTDAGLARQIERYRAQIPTVDSDDEDEFLSTVAGGR